VFSFNLSAFSVSTSATTTGAYLKKMRAATFNFSNKNLFLHQLPFMTKEADLRAAILIITTNK